jgi:hypothetical protein
VNNGLQYFLGEEVFYFAGDLVGKIISFVKHRQKKPFDSEMGIKGPFDPFDGD